MRKKEMKLIVTFHTTTDAMATEKFFKETDFPGRLIPVPREISAGCGLSWCTDEALEDKVISLLREKGIAHEGVFHCLVSV